MKRIVPVLLLLAVSTSLFAQVPLRAEAKFVCGRADPAHINAWAFSPGFYYTTLNVTNPNDNLVVNGLKRFSVARLSQQVGPWTGWVPWTLGPGQSMQVDCGDIYAHLGILPGTFIDGFVHFQANNRYAVTGVYTVGNGQIIVSNDVEAINVR
ncbi:MAG TPA: hypothetical protein VEO54_25090 [Thermoanaerobaculia bacterium]|nr:hypothetical protein [Thermoanaerobaculia bacterium]